ncbi:MAG: ribonuclease E, partial [Plesiomonas shigelloides]
VLSAEPAPVATNPVASTASVVEVAPVAQPTEAVAPASSTVESAVTAPVTTAPVIDSEPEVPAIIEKQPAATPVVETVVAEPVSAHHEAGECVVPAAVLEDAVIEINPVDAAVRGHARAGMTKAPAPAYTPSEPVVSTWVRPAYEFSGRGAAGSQAATHHASAAAAKPQSVE